METSQKKPFDQIFRPPMGREGHKKWFGIVHQVVMNVFEPFNSNFMMYLKLGLTQIGRKSGPPACCGTVTFTQQGDPVKSDGYLRILALIRRCRLAISFAPNSFTLMLMFYRFLGILSYLQAFEITDCHRFLLTASVRSQRLLSYCGLVALEILLYLRFLVQYKHFVVKYLRHQCRLASPLPTLFVVVPTCKSNFQMYQKCESHLRR